MSFKNLSLKNKLKVLAAFWVAGMVAIWWVAFAGVTMQRVVQELPPWEAFGAFVGFSLLLVVIYRGFGFHRPF